MDRRAFLTGLSALAAPAVADTQPFRRLARVGYLQGGVPVPERTDAFLNRLRELGWVEARTLLSSTDTPTTSRIGLRPWPTS